MLEYNKQKLNIKKKIEKERMPEANERGQKNKKRRLPTEVKLMSRL